MFKLIWTQNSISQSDVTAMLRRAVPRESQPWWWPPECQSCIHLPQSAARPLRGYWPETEMACWLRGSPPCGSHNRTGRTRHRRWARNILWKIDIQSLPSVYKVKHIPPQLSCHPHTAYLKLHQVIPQYSLNFFFSAITEGDVRWSEKKHRNYCAVAFQRSGAHTKHVRCCGFESEKLLKYVFLSFVSLSIAL